MTATANFRQMAQHIGLAICGLMMRTAFGVFGILWGIIREIVNGVFRVAIGVIVAILSTIAFFGFILWLFTLYPLPTWQKETARRQRSSADITRWTTSSCIWWKRTSTAILKLSEDCTTN